MSNLPECCYSINQTENPLTLIVIKKGESGYYRTDYPNAANPEAAKEWRDEMNDRLGVTKAQRAAMEVGSMLGWDVPGANPDNYDSEGRLLK
ncbi:MAG: hypothetical protein IKG72_13050 [Bacillus sp. (in: Bacteria)]|nr:hypothetical protein [Bacillus sp. (in: firmicutes)]